MFVKKIKQKNVRFSGVFLLSGGLGRNRTGIQGFAVLCITTLPPSLNCVCHIKQKKIVIQHKNI